jgi:hypothetical protein
VTIVRQIRFENRPTGESLERSLPQRAQLIAAVQERLEIHRRYPLLPLAVLTPQCQELNLIPYYGGQPVTLFLELTPPKPLL